MAATTDALAQTPADVDPTRTKTLRRRYAQKLRAGFRAINTEIRNGVRDRDVFNLERDTLADAIPPFRFDRDDKKVEAFRDWLDRQLETEVLETVGQDRNQFIQTAYRRGLAHADRELRQAGLANPSEVGSVINRPLHREELQLLYTRNFQALEGITAAVGKEVSRELADGLAAGEGPREIARRLTDRVDKIGLTRATTLARTEVINTFNEAALNRYEELGTDGVTITAEWQTAGDNRVCPICQALEGQTWTIEEVRETTVSVAGQSNVPVKPPAHPNCRCAIMPAGGAT